MASVDEILQLRVKTLPEGNYEVEISASASYNDLLARLHEATGVPLNRIRVIHRGRALKDEGSSLSDMGIQTGHTLHVVERPTAAGEEPPPTSAPPQQAQNNAQQQQRQQGTIGNQVANIIQGFLRGQGNQGQAGVENQGRQRPVFPSIITTLNRYTDTLIQNQVIAPPMGVTSLGPTPQGRRAFDRELFQLLENIEGAPESVTTQLEQLRNRLAQYTEEENNQNQNEQPAETSQQPDQNSNNLEGQAQAQLQQQQGQQQQQQQPQPQPQPQQQPYEFQALLVYAVAYLVQRCMEAIQANLLPGQARYLHDIMEQLPNQEQDVSTDLQRSVRQAAGQLHQYSALMVEAARVMSSLVAATEGRHEILTQNAAAVVIHERNQPMIPRLYPGTIGIRRQVRGMVVPQTQQQQQQQQPQQQQQATQQNVQGGAAQGVPQSAQPWSGTQVPPAQGQQPPPSQPLPFGLEGLNIPGLNAAVHGAVQITVQDDGSGQGQQIQMGPFSLNEDGSFSQVPGGQFPSGQFPGGQFPGSQFPGGQFPGGQFQGGQFAGGQIPMPGGMSGAQLGGMSMPLPPGMPGGEGFMQMPMGAFPGHIASVMVDIQGDDPNLDNIVNQINAQSGGQNASIRTTAIPLQVMEDGTIVQGEVHVSGEAGIGAEDFEGEGDDMIIDEGEEDQDNIAETINEQLRQALQQIPNGDQNPSWSPEEGDAEDAGQHHSITREYRQHLENLTNNLLSRLSTQDLDLASGIVQNVGQLLRHVTENWPLVEQFLQNTQREQRSLFNVMATVNTIVRELQLRLQTQRQARTQQAQSAVGDRNIGSSSQPSSSGGQTSTGAPPLSGGKGLGLGKGLGMGKKLAVKKQKQEQSQQQSQQQSVQDVKKESGSTGERKTKRLDSFPVQLDMDVDGDDDENIEVIDVSQPQSRQEPLQQQQRGQPQGQPAGMPQGGPGAFLSQLLGGEGGGGSGGGLMEMAQKMAQDPNMVRMAESFIGGQGGGSGGGIDIGQMMSQLGGGGGSGGGMDLGQMMSQIFGGPSSTPQNENRQSQPQAASNTQNVTNMSSLRDTLQGVVPPLEVERWAQVLEQDRQKGDEVGEFSEAYLAGEPKQKKNGWL
eukprot:TRINITY_DN17862_c0_g2_i3.p1 TRINITY_DN17862_c0_g2~~TRINITY_DN17862_c0_g2_i3.p1  ORF type:complete len:1105 (-),score=252.09 TRINITY_DN17862_c0_g2_i3:603-3917(-)